MVFQLMSVFPWRTAVRNVEFGLELQQVAEAVRRQKALQMIQLVGLSGFEEKYAIQLSDRVLVMSARPSSIREDIPIPLPRPRTIESLTSDAAVQIERRIWDILKVEAGKGLTPNAR